jgi:AraC-like DNA-binding protein
MRFVQNGREYLVQPGQVRMQHKGSDCEFEPGPEGYQLARVMRIDGPLLESLLEVTGLANCDVVGVRNPRRMAAAYRRAHELLRDRPAGFTLSLSGVAFEILMELAESYRYQGMPSLLAEALSLMDRRVSTRLSRSEVCSSLGVSAATLTRLFEKHLGIAPMKYHARRRLQMGATLLKSSSLSVKEIAARLGYDDPLHFSAEFKRKLGVAPSYYRTDGST